MEIKSNRNNLLRARDSGVWGGWGSITLCWIALNMQWPAPNPKGPAPNSEDPIRRVLLRKWLPDWVVVWVLYKTSGWVPLCLMWVTLTEETCGSLVQVSWSFNLYRSLPPNQVWISQSINQSSMQPCTDADNPHQIVGISQLKDRNHNQINRQLLYKQKK